MKREDFEKFAIAMTGHAALESNPATTLAGFGLQFLRHMADKRAAKRAQEAFRTLVDQLTLNEQLPSDQRHERAQEILSDASDDALDAVLERRSS